MELRQYLTLIRKWLWLIVLSTGLTAGSSYYYSLRIPPIYRAETTVLVGRLQENPNPNANELQMTTNMAQAYALLVTQPPILQATAEAVQWPESWQTLYFKVAATASGQLLKVSATVGNPHQAKLIADELAHQLALKSPIAKQQQQAEDQREFVTNQQAVLRAQIENGQKSLTDLDNQAALESDPKKLEDWNTRIASLQLKIDNWQKNYASLSVLLSSNASNFMTVLVPALEPTTPASPNIPQNVLLAALAGLVLAGGTILLLEYMDDTIKSGDDVQRELNLTTLGAITRFDTPREASDQMVTARHPRAPVSEAFRLLRTNLRFSGIENPTGVLLVTSASPREGKTTTAANLAITMAQAGKRVVLVDTDLRRPALHNLFGLNNTAGLSSLFIRDADNIGSVIQNTTVPGLRVIPSGPIPPNPAEILDSTLMAEVLANLRAESDMVILDSPPVMVVADACILGSHCSGAVIVIDAGHTRTEIEKRALATLQQSKVKVLGVVLNKLSNRQASGYYHYYRYEASPDGSQTKKKERKRA